MNLPVELRNPRKGLINTKNTNKKCSLWRHVNPSKEYPERIKKKRFFDLDYDGIELPVQEKYFDKTEVKNNICISVFG